jgi:hypothetical protein
MPLDELVSAVEPSGDAMKNGHTLTTFVGAGGAWANTLWFKPAPRGPAHAPRR